MSPAGATPAEKNVFCRPKGSKDNCCLHRGNSCRHLNEVCEGKEEAEVRQLEGAACNVCHHRAGNDVHVLPSSGLYPCSILSGTGQ